MRVVTCALEMTDLGTYAPARTRLGGGHRRKFTRWGCAHRGPSAVNDLQLVCSVAPTDARSSFRLRAGVFTTQVANVIRELHDVTSTSAFKEQARRVLGVI